jgi:hypothetical protein
VRRTKDGALAFLKPNHPSFGGMSTVPAAALEKIAADLAFDLSLPVPPVVLVDGTKVGGKCAAAALSRYTHPKMLSCADAERLPETNSLWHRVRRMTAKAWSGMFAFDLWLGNEDRENMENLLIGSDPNDDPPRQELVFIDYGRSMVGGGWRQKRVRETLSPPNLATSLASSADMTVILEVADQIARVPDGSIREIVNRIPVEFLSTQDKDVITDGLLSRRDRLRSTLGKAFR